jgi:hypothetical protein
MPVTINPVSINSAAVQWDLNHEVVLLLIPTAAFVWWEAMPRSEWVWRVAVPLAVHIAGRASLFLLLPAATAWEGGKIAFNLQLPLRNPGALAMALLTLVLLWGCRRSAGGGRLLP